MIERHAVRRIRQHTPSPARFAPAFDFFHRAFDVAPAGEYHPAETIGKLAAIRLHPAVIRAIHAGFKRDIVAEVFKADYEKLGVFYLGKLYDLTTGVRRADPLLYDAKDLVTHAVCVGMTGSGKTGLGIGLIEEAAIDNIPVLAIDPKGDLSNLLLTFPDLTPADFAPWVDPSDAAARGLTPDEQRIIEGHPALGERILAPIEQLADVRPIVRACHERYDGKGYPDHVRGEELSLGSRIMAVSDVFTALTENRPYRAGMDRLSTQKVLLGMVSQSALDPAVVDLLLHDFEELNAVRADAQSEAVLEYGEISGKVALLASAQA